MGGPVQTHYPFTSDRRTGTQTRMGSREARTEPASRILDSKTGFFLLGWAWLSLKRKEGLKEGPCQGGLYDLDLSWLEGCRQSELELDELTSTGVVHLTSGRLLFSKLVGSVSSYLVQIRLLSTQSIQGAPLNLGPIRISTTSLGLPRISIQPFEPSYYTNRYQLAYVIYR